MRKNTKQEQKDLIKISLNHLKHALSLLDETEIDTDEMNIPYYKIEDAQKLLRRMVER